VEDRRQDPSIEATYRARLAERRGEHARLEKIHARLAALRLALFFLAIAIVIVFGRGSAPWTALPLVAFLPLLYVHARVLNRRDRVVRAEAFYERGLARLTDRWHGTGERGERHRNVHHLYAEDLDLFGAGGLFELLVTARTRGGEDRLAAWLMAPSAPSVVRERQEAVRELAPKLDLREDLAVLGPEVDQTLHTDELVAWAAAPPRLQQRWPRIVLPLVATTSTALIIQWMWTARPPDLLVPLLVIQGLLALRFRHAAHHVAHGIEAREQELRALAMLIERIEREHADSALIRALRERVRSTGRAPADEIRRLARLIDILSSGHNIIFAPISALLLLGTQLAFAAEAWRARCGPAVPGWLDAVAEYEALSALSTYRAEHPDYPFPDIGEDAPLFDGEAVAHPLLPATAVANDVKLGGEVEPRLLLVSGSNMSGKSTLLRTVGLTAVLAQAGAPVRARRLRMTSLRIGATLRIQDSLHAGQSRFFAEISRISEIVAMTANATPVPAPSASAWGVLFLLDELLAGTNSHDRLEGATGILRGLLARGAIGLATTHDLALTAMVDGLDGQGANVHFEDRFEAGALTFDYRLKPGVVKSSNAIALMRAVGLDV
jgi:hypothetical protein